MNIDTKDLELIGHFWVDSGQAMVGDPCYLDDWINYGDKEFDIEGKEGEYSYFGACASTMNTHSGVLADGKAVVFSTGYGDGNYPVYAEYNDEGRVARIVIEFITEED